MSKAFRRSTRAGLGLCVLAVSGCQMVLGLSDHELGDLDTGGQRQTTSTVSAGGFPSTGSSAKGGTAAAIGGTASTTGGTAAGGTASFNAESSLVAHFAFDETSGTSAANSKDSTKNGIYVGSCTHPTGAIGGAVGLRNSNASTLGASDWVELPKGILSTFSEVTVSLWVRDLSSARTGGRALDFSLGSADEIYFSPDELNKTTSLEGAHLGGTHGGVTFVDLWTTTSFYVGQSWHHVAFTWSAASISLYVDGSLVGSKASPGVVPTDLGVTNPNWLGRTLNDVDVALYAEIDDLRIYSKVLSARDVTGLYSMR